VRVGVGVLVVDGDRVLMGRRLGSHGAGKLALPGGHLEVGESFTECAARELMEETGISMAAGSFEKVATTNDPMPGEDKHYVTIFVRTELPQGSVVDNCEPEKNAGWQWLTWAEVRALPESELFIPMQNLLAQGYSPTQSTASMRGYARYVLAGTAAVLAAGVFHKALQQEAVAAAIDKAAHSDAAIKLLAGLKTVREQAAKHLAKLPIFFGSQTASASKD
jgi:8-oxo-dGTP diphosphatase